MGFRFWRCTCVQSVQSSVRRVSCKITHALISQSGNQSRTPIYCTTRISVPLHYISSLTPSRSERKLHAESLCRFLGCTQKALGYWVFGDSSQFSTLHLEKIFWFSRRYKSIGWRNFDRGIEISKNALSGFVMAGCGRHSSQAVLLTSDLQVQLHNSKTPKCLQITCKKRDKGDRDFCSYHVTLITPPPRNLGIHCLPPNTQCGETVTVKGEPYIVSGVTYRYQLKRGKYEPCQTRLDVLSTGRYLVNLYLKNLYDNS